MIRTIRSHPFLYGLGCMAIFLFSGLGLFALGNELWVNGRPIRDLNASTQTQVDDIETDATAILVDTADIQPQTDGISTTVSAILADTATLDWAGLATTVSATLVDTAAIVWANVTDILADTAAIQPETDGLATSTSMILTDTAAIEPETDGLASSTTLIETTTNKIDVEMHTPEDFSGAHVSPSFPATASDADTMTPFVLIAGDNTWGAWLHVIGSTDLPIRSGMVAFDIHEILISSVSTAATGRIQLGWDLTTTSVILSNETFTSVMFQPSGVGANVSAAPIEMRMPDIAIGTLLWGRCWIGGENGATVSIFLGHHEFSE